MGVSSSTSLVRPREEVMAFLVEMLKLLEDEDSYEINNKPKANGKVNKTLKYMTERNLDDADVRDIIKLLTVANYSYTDLDRDSYYPNEYFWFFGITTRVVDKVENLYIKLKIRKFADGSSLLVMSFHPEMPVNGAKKLSYPYK